MNIIVVGAGIAGLSTAWSLVKAGHSVTLLEQGATRLRRRATITVSSAAPIARPAATGR